MFNLKILQNSDISTLIVLSCVKENLYSSVACYVGGLFIVQYAAQTETTKISWTSEQKNLNSVLSAIWDSNVGRGWMQTMECLNCFSP